MSDHNNKDTGIHSGKDDPGEIIRALKKANFFLASEVKRLEQFRERFEYIAGVTGTTIVIMDAAWNIVYADPLTKKIYGDPQAKTYGEYFPGRDSVAITRGRPDINEAMGPIRLERRLPDGEVHPVELHIIPFRDADGSSYFVEFGMDISAEMKFRESLEKTENRFSSLIQNISDIITVLDRSGNITYISPSAEKILGSGPGYFIGKSALNLVHPDDRARVLGDLTEVYERKNDGLPTEFRYVRPDGSCLHLESVANLLPPEQDSEGVVIIVRDITERKTAEEERLRLESRLQQSQKLESLGVLAGGIAHDFNNLLTGIMGNAELARLSLPPGSPCAENIEEIQKISTRAAELCMQMLAYSGKGRFAIQPLDLDELIYDMLPLMQISISKKSSLVLNLPPSLPPIMADPTQIRQVIMNLLINASEAIGDRGGTISVSTGVIEAKEDLLSEIQVGNRLAPGPYVYVDVSDTGPGIREQDVSRLFEPFYTTKFAGRGLGLAAVMGIIRGHGGTISVKSRPGKGSSFTALFPRAAGSVKPLAAEGRNAPAWKGSGLVLLIDDEETVLSVGRRMLESLGFTVITAQNGEEAIAVFRSAGMPVFCVVLDLTMPVMDGRQTLAELRKIDPSVRVIMSSGYSEKEVAENFPGTRIDGFIQKPYRLADLALKFRNL